AGWQEGVVLGREGAGSGGTRPVPEDPSRSAGAGSYVVGSVLVRQALRALAQRKGRTALTAFSIAIGIAAVVWVVAIGKAGQRRAEGPPQAVGEGPGGLFAGAAHHSAAGRRRPPAP